MPGTSPVILILGAGPNIGEAVARTFASKGYKVALAARSLREADSTENQLNITSDFANPNDVVNAFARVKKVLGIPSVVVYNAAAWTPSPPNDPFAIPFAAFNRDLTINTTSAFVAAQQAVLGFAELPAHAARTFFFTGNILNIAVLPSFMDAGAGKSAFYYADERKADGTAIFKVDGEEHGKLFWELAEAKTQGPWLQTFVKGVGYQNFDNLYRG
ncbi:hypothetical protein OIDMADRAFT_44315 [Oidiodendron maius Zn]|uniref:Uncharacterized protein n=1 Tax=Oidiodendron maius (strain Zn) TaxID=913774 RepID=A0A0C3GZZ6_OIDMZ|nr:hypothetical protein OIDMADRAFT_44315 [Oidiodendron maius Zn]